MSEQVFVELCAGLACVTMHAFGMESPVSRIGAKTTYAEQIRGHLGLEDEPHRVILVERDPFVATYLSMIFSRPSDVAQEVAKLGQGDARAVHDRMKRERFTEPVREAARFLLVTASSFGGIGGFKGKHKHRPAVDGFIPSRASLVDRVLALRSCPVEVHCMDAVFASPFRAIVYIDPPYRGRQGYGYDMSPEWVEETAKRWRRAGAMVGVSEATPLALGPGWTPERLKRRGQTRRSLTQNDDEWLTVSD